VSVGDLDALAGKSDHPFDEEHPLSDRVVEDDDLSALGHPAATAGNDPIARFERGMHRSLDDLVTSDAEQRTLSDSDSSRPRLYGGTRSGGSGIGVG
jgi:hypothetical protein